ncbi:nitroreductase family protein [Nocardioides marmotae]|uniref:nitroreductase family protein n=1 Tax=Nocardioides marmotae TaxID=2663857 RepID=UPI0012B59A08|nr:nitroreductase family protein [Nocardioides marmotae]MBC9732672.1 nitroreductase family protein [Nocardioides marmotae]MTB83789.1 nitroreductase family protein [Nocardioides marmotae]
MEFQEVVRRRRMVRRYDDRPVDPAVVARLLDNATRAPSAGFTQGWGFLVLEEPADVRRYWEATAGPERLAAPDRWLAGMTTAPVVIVPCSSKAAYLGRYAEPDKGWADPATQEEESRWAVPYWHMDTAMAALLVLQTAVDEGLGACFFGVPPAAYPGLKEAFGIPPQFDPIGAITVGHRLPDTGNQGSPARRSRRPADEVVHRGRWQGER